MKKLKKRLLSFATCMALIFSMLAFLPDMFSINAEAFTARKTAPNASDKIYQYYNLAVSRGGYNPGMPNCTVYAWARAYEILGREPTELSHLGNAMNWYGNFKDNSKKGQVPKVGAIACWGAVGNTLTTIIW